MWYGIALFPLAVLCAFLGALGGSRGTSKGIRRFGFPAVLTLYCLWVWKFNVWELTHLGIIAWLTMGYGIPDKKDKGSSMGRFYYNLFKKNERLANIFTRGTIGILVGAMAFGTAISSGTWILYLAVLGICTLAYVLFGAIIEKEGKIDLGRYELLLEDIYIYGIVSLAIAGYALIAKNILVGGGVCT